MSILLILAIGIILVNKGMNAEDKTGKVISNDFYTPDLKANQFSYLAASYDYYNPTFPENTSLYEGYIIEFEDDPVIVEHGKLVNKARENSYKIQDNSEFIKSIRGAFLLMPEDVNGKVEEYSLNIKDNNERTKDRILSELGESEDGQRISGNAIQNRVNTNSEVNLVFNGIAMNISSEEAQKVKNVRGVKNVYPNYKAHITLMDSVPMIGADDVWKLDADGNNCSVSGKECLTGKGVTIGIIDTGVDYTHPDLGGCFGVGCKVIGGYDFVNYDTNPMDDMGHGTHVTAIAAGNGVLKGVAPDAKIIAYKVCDSGGSCSDMNIIRAINRAADLNDNSIPMEDENDYVDVISLSLGDPNGNPNDPMSTAIDNIVNAGVVAVVAAGNSGPSSQTIYSPGKARNAITVGAIDKTSVIAEFSSRGPVVWTEGGIEKIIIKPDIVAPGVNICAAEWDSAWSDRKCLDNNHIAISGTSMATPHVSGAVALLKQKHPDWTPNEIKNSIKATANKLGYNSNVQGQGMINVSALISLDAPRDMWDFGITSPKNNELIGTNDFFEIKGVFPETYDSLIVEYRNSEVENSNWSSNGITIVGSNYTIARVDPQVYSNGGRYIFKVTITVNQETREETVSFVVDKTLMKGNPIKINSQAWMDFPILEDLNNDSVDELIFSTMPEGLIYVIDSNLENLPGWPKQIGSFGADTPPGGSPSIADLDNDGVKDIVLVSGYSAAGRPGYLVKSYVYAFHLNGDSFKGFPVAIELSDPLHLPTIYDINNDGKLEIIVTTGAVAANTLTNEWYENRKIYVINNKGEFLTNWPVETTNTLKPLNGASIIDLDNDGKSEIIVGTINYSATSFNRLSDMESFYFNGSMVRGFPKQLGTVYSITSEDLNEDGFTEIIINSLNNASILSVFSYINGSFKEYCTNHQYSENVVIGDINKDSKSEIISLNGDSLSVLNYNCSLLPGWPKSATGYVYRQPIIANIDGDANEEILVVGQDGGVFAFNFKGETVAGFPKYVSGQGKDLTVGNFDSDAFIELIVTSKVAEGGNIYVFNLNASYNKSLMAWPKYRHDSQRTNCYDCDKLAYESCGDRICGSSETCANCVADCGCSLGYTCNSAGQCVPTTSTWQTGMVSWWKLDGNASDSIGTNHGTVNGATLTSTGCKSGQCYSFDGVNDYVNIPSSQFLPLIGKPYTLSAWVNDNTTAATLTSTFHRIISFANGAINIQLGLANTGGTPNNRIFYIQESSVTSNARQITSGNVSNGWHHVVATSNGAGAWSIYLDGVLSNGGTTLSSGSTVYTTNTGLLYMGQRGNGGYVNGKLDEVMIWNRSLSSTEIQQVYSSYQGCTSSSQCNDSNACSYDVCSGGSCEHISISDCCTSDSQCNDSNVCTTEFCAGGSCAYALKPNCCTSSSQCNDSNACTNDVCAGGSCTNVPIICNIGYTCNSAGQCVPTTPNWQTGLVSWWKLNGDASDSVGTNHGTINGATLTSTDCKSGQCYSFDGVNDYLNVPSSKFLLLIGKPYTISAWVNDNSPVATLDTTYHRIISFANGAINIQLGLANRGGTPNNRIFYIQESTSGAVRQVTSGNVSNGWHHLVATSNGAGTWNIYLDGVLSNGGTTISSSSSVYTTNTGNLYIGQRGNGGYVNGKLDEVMVWNRVLSSTEIQQVYNLYSACTPNCAGKVCGADPVCGTSCGSCSTGQTCNSAGQCVPSTPAWQTGLVSWWKLNGDMSDSIGTNHGTVNGATLTSTGCKSGQCYSFDGVNDYLNLPSSQFLPLIGKPYTFSAWINDNTTAATLTSPFHRIISFANGAINIQLGLANTGGTPNNRIFYIQESSVTSNARQITLGNVSNGWHHVVATSNGAGAWSIYLDGVLSNGGTALSSGSTVYTTNTGLLYMGQRGNGGFVNGLLDEIMVFNRSLNSTEIQQIYNSF